MPAELMLVEVMGGAATGSGGFLQKVNPNGVGWVR